MKGEVEDMKKVIKVISKVTTVPVLKDDRLKNMGVALNSLHGHAYDLNSWFFDTMQKLEKARQLDGVVSIVKQM